MSLETAVKGKIISGVLDNVAKSQHTTTVLGGAAAALIGAQIDWSKLLQKDPNEIAKAVGAALVFAFGYFTNHPKLTGAQ